MIRNCARFVCVIFLLVLAVGGYTQSKTTPKAKAAPATKKTVKPVEKKDEVKEETPPEVEELEKAKVGTTTYETPALPPLPEIDSTAAPDDELTKEIKAMLTVSGAMKASMETMKYMIELDRKNPSRRLSDEFYDRFLQSIESGRIGKLLENAIVKVYRARFTLQEMKEINAFFATVTGKKMAMEQSAIANDSRIAGEKIGGFIAMQIMGDLIRDGKLK
jgi:hypothetical protein